MSESITKDANGKWHAVLELPRVDGKRRRKTFTADTLHALKKEIAVFKYEAEGKS